MKNKHLITLLDRYTLHEISYILKVPSITIRAWINGTRTPSTASLQLIKLAAYLVANGHEILLIEAFNE